MSAEPRPFDVCGPLPEPGVTVLEASAGTGKTFTIAALAARYVADGIPLDQLLLVTFTRMATGELRERVRERLVSAEQGLERALAGAPPDAGDGVVRLLAQGAPDAVRARRERLARALAAFDAATIATTHGFCQEVLGGLGVAGDVEPGAALVEDVDDLIEEVVDDLFIRRFHDADVPEFGRAQALEIARLAVENPTAPIEPRAAAGAHDRRDAPAAGGGRAQGARRAQAAHRRHDLRRPAHPARRRAARGGRRRRRRPGCAPATASCWWTSSRTRIPCSGTSCGARSATGGVTLVLIGDPKQAIYAFRGADVYAYLDAAGAAARRATLDVNWRSDQALIDAYDALFAGARLGHEGIVYRTVRAAAANRAPRLEGAPDGAALRVRIVHRDAPSIELTRGGLRGVGLHPPARRRRPGRRRRAPAALGGRGRDPRGGRHGAAPRAGPARPRRGAGAQPPAGGADPRRAGRRRGPGRHQRGRQRVRLALGRRTGCGCSRPSSGRRTRRAPARPRSRRSSAGAPSGWRARARRSGRSCTAGCTPGRACCGSNGVASLTETLTLAEGLPGRRPRRGGRGAPADRPAPRRAAPPRRGGGRAHGHRGAHGVAAPAHRRRGAGDGRRGAQPPARVRRRGRAGHHHPPQQGARVPDRLRPVRVRGDLDPAATTCRSTTTTPTRTTPARSTSAWTARTGRGTSGSTCWSSGRRTSGSSTSR